MQTRKTTGPMSLCKNIILFILPEDCSKGQAPVEITRVGKLPLRSLLLFVFSFSVAFQVEVERKGKRRQERTPCQSEGEFVAYDNAHPRLQEICQVIVRQVRLPKDLLDLPMPVGAWTVAEPIPRSESNPRTRGQEDAQQVQAESPSPSPTEEIEQNKRGMTS